MLRRAVDADDHRRARQAVERSIRLTFLVGCALVGGFGLLIVARLALGVGVSVLEWTVAASAAISGALLIAQSIRRWRHPVTFPLEPEDRQPAEDGTERRP